NGLVAHALERHVAGGEIEVGRARTDPAQGRSALVPFRRDAERVATVAADAALEVEIEAAHLAGDGRREQEGKRGQEEGGSRHPWWQESREMSCRPPSAIRTMKKRPANIPARARKRTTPRGSRRSPRQLINAAPSEPAAAAPRTSVAATSHGFEPEVPCAPVASSSS